MDLIHNSVWFTLLRNQVRHFNAVKIDLSMGTKLQLGRVGFSSNPALFCQLASCFCIFHSYASLGSVV